MYRYLSGMAPDRIDQIKDGLDVLLSVGCHRWTPEIKGNDALIWTKQIIDAYLQQSAEKSYFESLGLGVHVLWGVAP